MGYLSYSNILQLISIICFWQTAVGNVFNPHVEKEPEVGIDFQCVNNKDWLFSNDSRTPCAGVQTSEEKRVELCRIKEVSDNCPVSCGKCCENDINYRIKLSQFYGSFALQSCEWLGTSIRSHPKWWCGTYHLLIFFRKSKRWLFVNSIPGAFFALYYSNMQPHFHSSRYTK